MTNPIYILHVSSARSWRGGEQQIAYLMEGLNVLRFKSHLLSPKRSALNHYFSEKNVRSFAYTKRSGMSIQTARQLIKNCRDQKIDIVHLHDSHAHNTYMLAYFLGLRVPAVLHIRLVKRISFLGNWKYNIPGIKRIICISEAVKQSVKDQIRSKAKLEVIYSGIQLPAEVKQKTDWTEKTKLKLGTVSTLSKDKDLGTLIRCIGHFVDRFNGRIQLDIIGGDQGELRSLEKQIKDKNLRDRIQLLGFQENAKDRIADWDIYISSSKREALGTSILDAMALGMPIVSTKIEGVKEYLRHERNALLVEVGDFENMAKAIRILADDFSYAMDLGKQAQKDVRQFAIEQTIHSTENLYTAMLLEENKLQDS